MSGVLLQRYYRRLTAPLAPSTNDPVFVAEPVRASCFAGVLLATIVASTWGTYALGTFTLQAYGLDYIVASVPFFFLMIVVEALLIHKAGAVKGSPAARYHAYDTWSSLTAGVSQMVWLTFLKRFFSHAVLYAYVWEHYRLTATLISTQSMHDTTTTMASLSLSLQWWCTALVCFVAADFVYYWFHRAAHEYAPLWTGHNVHHSSEHYNLSTALRQSWRQALISPFWSLPFAVVGLPPHVFFLASQWVTIYQFWIHTCVIRRLGWLEYVFNTPSHHRCHHDRRLHKNFAGVFIVWDRLFGTFQDELAVVVDEADNSHGGDAAESELGAEICFFGIQEVVPSWAEAAIQWMMILRTRNWWVGPGYTTSTAHRPLPKYVKDAERGGGTMRRVRIHEPSSDHPLRRLGGLRTWYVWAQFLVSFGLFVVQIADQPQWPDGRDALLLFLFLVASLMCQGLLLDDNDTDVDDVEVGFRSRRWLVWGVELFRTVVGVLLFESWSWYALSWAHVASFIVCFLWCGDRQKGTTLHDKEA